MFECVSNDTGWSSPVSGTLDFNLICLGLVRLTHDLILDLVRVRNQSGGGQNDEDILLGLLSQGIVDATVLNSLVRPDQLNLTLKRGGSVLMRHKTVGFRLLEACHQLVGVGDEYINKVLPINRLEGTSI